MLVPKRILLIRILTVAVVLGIAAWMFVIGRGHTIYFDNKELTTETGETFSPFYKVEVFVNDQSVAKLKEGDRGMVTTMGQKFKMVLHITPKKDGKKVGSAVSLELPYSMDGIVLNLPALLNGADETVYLDEFIPTPVEEDADADVVVTDEFEMPMGGE